MASQKKKNKKEEEYFKTNHSSVQYSSSSRKKHYKRRRIKMQVVFDFTVTPPHTNTNISLKRRRITPHLHFNLYLVVFWLFCLCIQKILRKKNLQLIITKSFCFFFCSLFYSNLFHFHFKIKKNSSSILVYLDDLQGKMQC